MTEAALTMRIRPFTQYMSRGTGVPAAEVIVRIVNEWCVLSIFGLEIALPTREVGVDKDGHPFAVVESDFEHALTGEYKVRTAMEFYPPDEDGFSFSPTGYVFIWREGPHREAAREQIRKQGGDPDRVNLVIPVAHSFAVHFNHDGTINGTGGCGPSTPYDPTDPPKETVN